MLSPWSQISSLQSSEKINFCCLSHPVCVLCYESLKFWGKEIYLKLGLWISFLWVRYLVLSNHSTPRITIIKDQHCSGQFSSVAQSCQTLCDPMGHSTPGLPVHHQLPEFTQTHVHRVSDAIQPSLPLSSPSPPTFNLSQHQGLFKWVSSSHQVAKVLEFQLQHQSFHWIFRTDLL